MPLSKTGTSLMRKFIEMYGSKKGKRIFYSKENSDKKFAHAVKK